MIVLTFVLIILYSYRMIICSGKSDVIAFDRQKTDLLKVILPFFIILHHTSGGALSDFIPAGKYVVAIFFFISGYGLECKRQNTAPQVKHLTNRLRKLLLPIIVPMCLYLSVRYVMGLDIIEYACNSIKALAFPLPNSWFVLVLAIMYLLYYCVLFTAVRHPLLWITFAVLLLDIVLFVLYRQDTHLYASNLAFPLGMLYKHVEGRITPALSARTTSLLLSIALIGSCILVPYRNFAIINILLYSLFVVLMLVRMPLKACPQTNLFGFFRNISYEMYLCQGIAILTIPYYPEQGKILYAAIIILATIFVSLICQKITNSLFGDVLQQGNR